MKTIVSQLIVLAKTGQKFQKIICHSRKLRMREIGYTQPFSCSSLNVGATEGKVGEWDVFCHEATKIIELAAVHGL